MKQSHAAHSYLKGPEGRWTLSLETLCLESRRLLFEASPLQPADHEAGARKWLVYLWLQVFSLQTWPCQVSPFPCVMGLPRTQAWLPTAEGPWTWAVSTQRFVAVWKEDSSQECSFTILARPG